MFRIATTEQIPIERKKTNDRQIPFKWKSLRLVENNFFVLLISSISLLFQIVRLVEYEFNQIARLW